MKISELFLRDDGSVEHLRLGAQEIDFRQDEYRGVRLYAIIHGHTRWSQFSAVPKEDNCFTAELCGLRLRLQYQLLDDRLSIHLRAENLLEVCFKPEILGLRLGLNHYMERYPGWDTTYFPTLLRAEKTHFWGYSMTPEGQVLAVSCAQPVAAWSLCYSTLQQEDEGDWNLAYLDGGHRIYTQDLHLLNRPPLPARHPALEDLGPGEVREWEIVLKPISELSELPEYLSSREQLPMIAPERCCLRLGQCIEGRVWNAQIEVWDPDGEELFCTAQQGKFRTEPLRKVGAYRLLARSLQGRQSEGMVYVLQPESWYLKKGRDAVLQAPPIPTHHMESFNSLYTLLLARKHFPSPEKDEAGMRIVENITRWLYDQEKGRVRYAAQQRIQDTASLAAVMALCGEVTGERRWLTEAGRLADFLMMQQDESGAYICRRTQERSVHYTAVSYLARYMMDVVEAEKNDPELCGKAALHRKSAKRAVEDLLHRGENIETEGEMTFEDGMISCSVLQLAHMALQTDDTPLREKLIEQAEFLYRRHRCLTQLMIPDCRMRGATLRFWEMQYNLNIFSNGMNSPCGWTCWQIYAVWYLYQLTGKAHYLYEAMDGLGACLQLVDSNSGQLRWGFLPDPWIKTQQYVQRAPGVEEGVLADVVLGEQYLEMITPWHRKEAFPRNKFSIDQLVHEVFKCQEEISLTRAYLLQKDDGSLVCWNCRAQWQDGRLQVEGTEPQTKHLHVNLTRQVPVCWNGAEPVCICFGWTGKAANNREAEV